MGVRLTDYCKGEFLYLRMQGLDVDIIAPFSKLGESPFKTVFYLTTPSVWYFFYVPYCHIIDLPQLMI